jgi:glucose/arabinose dehydrogenase
MKKLIGFLVLALVVVVAAIGAALFFGVESAKLAETASFGPSPTLPEPSKVPIPTVNIAHAKGWPEGAKPTAASGLAVNAFASGLEHPRWLFVLPNGDVLVAESNGPPRPEDAKGVKGFVYKQAQKWAGAGVPSANRITLLRDNGNGVATKHAFLEGLNSPFGMALVGNDLYVANTDAILRFPYTEGATRIGARERRSPICRRGRSITIGPRT